jgi:hypothetical protein
MILLTSTSDKLQLVTSAAVTVDVHASWVDNASGTITPGRTNTGITTATTTDIVAAPGSSTQRNVKSLHVVNRHASTSTNVTIKHTDGSTTPQLTTAITLLAGESLEYVEGQGFRVYDATGQPKVGQYAVDPTTNTFRLTGVTATPVMTAESSSLSTIYLAQYKGNSIALYDGTYWQLSQPTSEPSLAVTGRTTDLPFDIFAYLSSGTVTLEFLDWSSATARVTGLTRVNGVWTKTGDSTRRYLGTCRARSSTTYHWITQGDGASAPTKLDLWNVDNRVEIGFKHIDSTNSWAYTTATIRQANGTTNNQLDVVVGLQEDYVHIVLCVTSRNSTISIAREAGIAYDSTSTFTDVHGATNNTVASINCCQIGSLRHQPAIGRHFYSWNEISTATGTCTWVGDDGSTRVQSGMTGAFAM